ncbi:RNA-directed DNA polymerase, eukaryota, reverse transcriptase zinc-binding domain protein [Tanacetum coccineum]
MSPIKRKLKRRIKPPKRYEGSISTISKRNESENETSNDEISMENVGKNRLEEVDLCMDQSGKETWEINEVMEGNKTESGGMQEEVQNDELKEVTVDENVDSCNPDKSIMEEIVIGDPKLDDHKVNSGNHRSYANMVRENGDNINKKLIFIAPKITRDGEVKVMFDANIVNKGCAKWKFTLCGHFVGQNMSYFELRYHTRRMWGKYGLKEIIVNSSGINLFKFRDEVGMKCFLEQGPWLIRNMPLFVQKWNPEIGISALASSIGKPKIMDETTANVCQYGVGRTDYTRVLVEVAASKELQDSIKIEYIGDNEVVKGTKLVKVMYDWKPERCTYCKVFGHCLEKCSKRPMTSKEVMAKELNDAKLKETKDNRQNDGFIGVQHRKKNDQRQKWN